MKILAIGNSFSEDATYYLSKIAASAGADVTVVNLFIGGCSLERHAENIRNNTAAYRYERNGLHTDRTVSLLEALTEEAWDIVTIQQTSGQSGIYESYGQGIRPVLAFIRRHAPQAKVYFHETWAYEIDSNHPDFALYGNDQETMYRAITDAVSRVCQENGNLSILPAGQVFHAVRKHPVFDYSLGGQGLCRDGFHLHLIYGRYLAGLVWFAVLLGGRIADVSFVPAQADIVNGYIYHDFPCDLQKLELLREIAKHTLSQ